MGAKKDPKKDAKTPSKTPKKKEGGGGKAKKKKWSKGKTRSWIKFYPPKIPSNIL